MQEHYQGRPSYVAPLNISLDRDAIEILRLYCPSGRRNIGRFLSRLLFEHQVRQEHRAQSVLPPVHSIE